jgi:3-isopropylmalate/(R)-2-methylmalate dehydratase large subunit
MTDRITLCNMAAETGAKNAIVEPDQITFEFLKGRLRGDYEVAQSDEDANYSRVLEFSVNNLDPLVAVPSLPSNVKVLEEVRGTKINQVFIGSCTNGTLEDFKRAARVLTGRKVHDSVRLIAIPGTQEIFAQMIDQGIAKILVDSGAALSSPTCGPCLGGHMGVLAAEEVALSTTNRNFVGRMGHKTSKVYLASPAVAAATAILGEIADPREL